MFLDHKQLDKHTQYDSSETVVNQSRRPLVTQHNRRMSMNSIPWSQQSSSQTY